MDSYWEVGDDVAHLFFLPMAPCSVLRATVAGFVTILSFLERAPQASVGFVSQHDRQAHALREIIQGKSFMLKTIATTAFLATAAAGSAHAIPASSPGATIPHSGFETVQVQHRGKAEHRGRAEHRGGHDRNWNRGNHYNGRNHWRGRQHWGGGRYHGWHRYGARPYNWRTRGCVVVGPAWLCP